MKRKKTMLLAVGITILLSITFCGCSNKKPNYSGTMDGYRYYYAEGRDRLWEEDILYMAEVFLKGHPALSDSDFMIQTFDIIGGNSKGDYSNARYDGELRQRFIDEINLLISRISELDDYTIQFEAMRISALLEDVHSGVSPTLGDLLPLCFQLIGGDSEYLYCMSRSTTDYAHLLGSRLTAINDVPIEEIVSRLAEYVSHENMYGLYATITSPIDELCYLTQKPALCAIGVVEPEAETAEVTFDTGTETVVETVEFASWQIFYGGEFVDHPMVSADTLQYSRKDNFWYVVMADEPTPYIYVRIQKMYEQTVSFQSFLTTVAAEIKNSEIPLRVIVDFRDNGGGELQLDPVRSFANAVNRYQTNGTYILINGGCFSAGMMTPYVFSELIEGAELVGSPTGQPGNCYGAMLSYNTPNYQMYFWVSDNYIYGIPGDESDAVYPAMTVSQTWEDYRNHLDTVLEYVLALK